jgi:hypothetical protein
MKLNTFYTLRNWCLNNTNLQGSKTQDVSIEDKLVIFLWTVSYGISNRAAQEVFGRAAGTINKCFSEVLQVLLILHKEVVKLPTESTKLASRIADDPKLLLLLFLFTSCLSPRPCRTASKLDL